MISINGVKIVPLIFSDKTSQVWKLPENLLQGIYKEPACTIKWEFETEAEFLQIAQLKTLLDTYCDVINLDMPYLPYGRQDKRVENNSTFALHAFAKVLNALNFNEVHTIDAHNNLRAHMIKGLEDHNASSFIMKAADAVGADLFLFPDAGAKTRYENLPILRAGRASECVYANKVREQSTGLIKSITIVGKVKGKKLLICDDIADGSMTFILLAKEALKQGAQEVHLYVTHGIFSKGTEIVFASGISRIFTHKGEQPRVTVPLYDGGH